jgi:hypothetical protein
MPRSRSALDDRMNPYPSGMPRPASSAIASSPGQQNGPLLTRYAGPGGSAGRQPAAVTTAVRRDGYERGAAAAAASAAGSRNWRR